ncbi:MAG: hypothetical protein ACO3WU_14020, partial [Ilumatobacteraceae bacterium]
FPTLFLLRRTKVFMPLFTAASLALAALSLTWVWERITETEVGINGLVDRVILWPRSFWAMVVVTAIAGVVHLVVARRDGLLPTASAHAESPPTTDEVDVTDEDEPALV